MDESSTTCNQVLEESILRIIAKIKKNRNRPCFQNIHSLPGRILGACNMFTINNDCANIPALLECATLLSPDLLNPVLTLENSIGARLLCVEGGCPQITGIQEGQYDCYTSIMSPKLSAETENKLSENDTNSEISDDHENDPNIILTELRMKNSEKIVIGHLNINFLLNKFEPLKSLIRDRIDILLISETKLDESFPLQQFEIEGYHTPFRLDRNCNGGGIIMYIKSGLPCKELKSHKSPEDLEEIFL